MSAALVVPAFLLGALIGGVVVHVTQRRLYALFSRHPLFVLGRIKDVRGYLVTTGDWRDGSSSDDALFHLGKVEAHVRAQASAGHV